MMLHHSPFPAAETRLPDGAVSHRGTSRLSLVVVLYFLMIALPVQFNLGPIFMTGVRVVLLVAIIPLTIRLLGGKFGPVLPTDILLLLYLGWSVAMLFVHSPSQAVSVGGIYVVELFGGYVLARAYIRTSQQFRAMCLGLFAIFIFSVPFAIYETQTGTAPIPAFIASIPGISSYDDYVSPTFGRRLGLERSQVIFSHPIHYGLFCASLISLALVGFKDDISNLRRYLLGLLISVGVISSVSSGAILPMALQVFLIFWAWAFRRVPSRWVILFLLVVFCYVVVDLISNRTAIEVFLSRAALSGDTAYGRIIIFEWGMINVWNNPLLGLGLNDWVRPIWLAASLDNFWLLLTVRYGIPAFVLIAAAYLGLVWKVMRSDLGEDGPAWRFRRAWVFLQIAVILTLCTVDIWESVLSFGFFLLGAGAWLTGTQPTDPAIRPVAAPGSGETRLRYSRFAGGKERQAPKFPRTKARPLRARPSGPYLGEV